MITMSQQFLEEFKYVCYGPATVCYCKGVMCVCVCVVQWCVAVAIMLGWFVWVVKYWDGLCGYDVMLGEA